MFWNKKKLVSCFEIKKKLVFKSISKHGNSLSGKQWVNVHSFHCTLIRRNSDHFPFETNLDKQRWRQNEPMSVTFIARWSDVTWRCQLGEWAVALSNTLESVGLHLTHALISSQTHTHSSASSVSTPSLQRQSWCVTNEQTQQRGYIN